MGDLLRHILSVLPGFALACLVLALIPGPATALVLQRSLRDGRGAGLASMAGNELGLFGWALASGAGLTALLQAHRVLFESMRWVGAGMLIWLGISAWRAAGRGVDVVPLLGARRASKGAAFRASLLSVAANPKAAVFSFSFFPQFLPHQGSVFLGTVLLALIWILIDGVWCACVAIAATRARKWLAQGPVRRWMERVMGAILVGLGIELATDSR
ncbi:LysE family translocator [Pendulispora brunnea]|uniref:LysE family translocator n=1 Tax=Pendulispora brunnea TaxID=2905690 RepID=A0ABZ2JVJ2_9BACT